MESKILNLEEAMRLASILTKYIDTVSITPDLVALDFIANLLNTIEPTDYLKCVKMLSGEDSDTVSKLSGKQLLEILFSGLEKNKILSLLDAHRTIGFV